MQHHDLGGLVKMGYMVLGPTIIKNNPRITELMFDEQQRHFISFYSKLIKCHKLWQGIINPNYRWFTNHDSSLFLDQHVMKVHHCFFCKRNSFSQVSDKSHESSLWFYQT